MRKGGEPSWIPDEAELSESEDSTGHRLQKAPSLSTLNARPEKYSQAYFEDRIQSLRASISKSIPNKDDLLKQNDVFIPVVRSLRASKQALHAAKTVETELQKEQKKHPEDDGWKDSSLLDPIKQTVQETQAAIDSLKEATANAGCDIVKKSNLLNINPKHDHVHTALASHGKRPPYGKRKDGILCNGILTLLERDLLECTVLVQATPAALAQWCAKAPDTNHALLDRFFGEKCLMVRFLEAGGPSKGNYGPALSIYDKLQEELRIADKMDGYGNNSFHLRQRLALAVALELATPIPVFKHEKDTFVDPIKRFRYYAKFATSATTKATDDQLDKAFGTLSVWELRKVIDSNATHEDLTWGREFLRNYRPDQATKDEEKWKYVRSVRTDVGYRHPDHAFDNYQELISAGGECGPRAFFGRFISKAWGLPTWGVRQPGHAAMTRWTSKGWTVCLGAPWEYSWWDDDRYGELNRRNGPDFLEETQARTSAGCVRVYYKKVVLLECLAESLGETVEEEFLEAKFWRSLALAQRNELAREGVAAVAKNSLPPCQLETDAPHGCICKGFGSTCHKFPNKFRGGRIQKYKFVNRGRLQMRTSKEPSQVSRRRSEWSSSTRNDRALTLHNVYNLSTSDTLWRRSECFAMRREDCLACMEKMTIDGDMWTKPDGTIVIPAGSIVAKRGSVQVMKSFLGGNQLHLEHDGAVQYQLPSRISDGSSFELSAKVVNVHRFQVPLKICIENPPDIGSDDTDSDGYDSFEHLEDLNGYEMIHLPQGQELEVPYTQGYWSETKSIRVDLHPNGLLKLSREDPCFGLSIKQIILRPISGEA